MFPPDSVWLTYQIDMPPYKEKVVPSVPAKSFDTSRGLSYALTVATKSVTGFSRLNLLGGYRRCFASGVCVSCAWHALFRLGGRAGSLRARRCPNGRSTNPHGSPFLRLVAQKGLLETPTLGEKPWVRGTPYLSVELSLVPSEPGIL